MIGRLFGLISLLLGVWALAEVYTKGMDHAFGGVFAALGEPISEVPETDGRTLGQRVGDHVQHSLDEAHQRRYGDAE